MAITNYYSRRELLKMLALGASSGLLLPFSNFKLPAQMNFREIPSTGEKMPCIGLGTWQTFDVGKSEAERAPLREVLKKLLEYGGSVIDSSPMYGRSEGVVGELTTELDIKDKIFEATKVWTTGEQAGINQMNDSMQLMRAKPMDLMQIHNLLDWRTHIKTLREMKERSEIRYIGITHYHEGGYSEMEHIMKTEPIDFIQINYNLARREAENRILPLAKDKGIGVLINRPYEGGALFRNCKDKPLPVWALEFDAMSCGQFFLKFILAHEAVTCVIPGTSKVRHMEDNARAGFGSVPDAKQKAKMIDWFKSL